MEEHEGIEIEHQQFEGEYPSIAWSDDEGTTIEDDLVVSKASPKLF